MMLLGEKRLPGILRMITDIYVKEYRHLRNYTVNSYTWAGYYAGGEVIMQNCAEVVHSHKHT